MKKLQLGASILFLALMAVTQAAFAPPALGLGSAFTYQGQLKQSGLPAEGLCDFRFTLHDAPSAGTQIGGAIVVGGVALTEGRFSVPLDFGSAPFASGGDRWLGIEVRCPANVGSYTPLLPRQQLTATPYALFSPASGSVPWSGVSGIPPGFGDGVDNDTTYTKGPGLLLSGNQFSVDTSSIQARVATSCTPGTSIRSIDASGGVTCEADDDSGGTITGVVAGNGLSGGGSTGTVSLDVSFGGSGAAVTAARSDHSHEDQYEQKFRRTVVVSPVGTASQNGAALLAAVADLTVVAPCTEPNFHLVKVEPGIYDLGGHSLHMMECVDIEGSGEHVTFIRSSGYPAVNTGTVVGAPNSELRFATIESAGSNDSAVAIYSDSVAAMKLTHVTAKASGGANNYAIVTKDSAVEMNLVTAEASGGNAASAISIMSSDFFQLSPTLTNVRATADMASSIVAAIYNEGSSVVMTNVNVSATGMPTGAAYGVFNSGPSLPVISGGGIVVAGADNGIGVLNGGGAGTRMEDTTVSVFGNNVSHGIDNLESSVTLSGIRVIAFLSATSVGIVNAASSGAFFVDVDDSQIAADTNTIVSASTYATRIGASKLQGGSVVANGGVVTCAGVYDESYVFTAGPGCP